MFFFFFLPAVEVQDESQRTFLASSLEKKQIEPHSLRISFPQFSLGAAFKISFDLSSIATGIPY